MAPLRSHIMRMLVTEKTKRRATYWYGARSKREMFYVEDFDGLAAENPNFEWHVAPPSPCPRTTGPATPASSTKSCWSTTSKPRPEDIEYYLCGPPMMNAAV
ncbi:MAG: hypothetical protein R3E96_16745 [Planctomycetota bacterium]